MFGIGETEFLIILLFAFLLFGPDKMPQMGRTIGRAIRQFRETQQKMTAVVQSEVIDPMAAASKPKSVKKACAAAVAEDEDIDQPVELTEEEIKRAERRKESFAERRARLAAEKAAQQTALEDEINSGHKVATTEIEPVVVEEQQTQESVVEEVSRTRSLYARRERKSDATPSTTAGEERER